MSVYCCEVAASGGVCCCEQDRQERMRELAVRIEGQSRPFTGMRPSPAYELACLILGKDPNAETRPMPTATPDVQF